MPLLTPADVQAQLNINLTDPAGVTVTTGLINAAVAIASSYVGYSLEEREAVTYASDGGQRFWLPTMAPVTAVSAFSYNSATGSYDEVASTALQFDPQGNVWANYGFTTGFNAIQFTYTAGWTSANLPADLKQALIDLVGYKLQVANAGSTGSADDAPGALKRVTSGSYSEEYVTPVAAKTPTVGDTLPLGITEVLDRYRLPIAL